MSQPVSTKVHAYIGHPRSLCGLTSKNGNYTILSFPDFFVAPDDNQCLTCLRRVKDRGYSIERLRRHYRTIQATAEPIDQIHAGQEMSHWIAQSRNIINQQIGAKA